MQALKDMLNTFLAALPALLPEHEGKYALVCDGDVTVYDRACDALEKALTRCTDFNKFIVIKIERPEAALVK